MPRARAAAAFWLPSRRLELQSDGRGWARNTVNRLCIDSTGRVSEPCTRDNVKESYLTPIDHPVTVRLTGAVPVGATCAWSFDDGDGSAAVHAGLRRAGQFARALWPPDRGYGRCLQRTGRAAADPTEIMVRDIFIAGLGDRSHPAKAIRTGRSRCPTRVFASALISAARAAQYYRPSRAGYKGGRACEAPDTLQVWQRQSALWFNSACHRSLYSYQTRTALALAVQYPHIAVTYLPLACTGATIADGLFGAQRARECPPTKSGSCCQAAVNAQLAELRDALDAAKRRQPDRKLDLVLLSIGANDINFSGSGRQRHRRCSHRTRAVPAHRRDRLGRRVRAPRWRATCRKASASCARR